MIAWWVELWDRREHPRSLGLLRIALGLVLLWDYLEIARLGLVVELLGDASFGGLADVVNRNRPPWFYQLFPVVPASAHAFHLALCLAASALIVGFATRVAAVALVLLSAQFALMLPGADRGIDMLVRNLLLVLACSRCGAWASLDARVRSGSWWGDGAAVPAWPRHLIVLQVVVMYFTAGVQKVGYAWTPFGSFTALYLILQDTGVARRPFGWLEAQPWLALTQLGTAVTVVWEWSAPCVLWVFLGRAHPERSSRLRALAVRHNLHLWWLLVGVVFHVLIALTLELGIFPWAMLATYAAFVHPDQWSALARKWRNRSWRVPANELR